MPDPIFERYKEALRAGHVAALRGRLDDALINYRRAAAIADERALPHASMAGVLLRLGRVEEAAAAYGRAVERAPGDEGALSGRAEALIAAGKAAEAAQALDHLAEVLEAAGKPAEALTALHRAFDLVQTGKRRSRVKGLQQAVRAQLEAAAAAPPLLPEGGPDADAAASLGEAGEPAAASSREPDVLPDRGADEGHGAPRVEREIVRGGAASRESTAAAGPLDVTPAAVAKAEIAWPASDRRPFSGPSRSDRHDSDRSVAGPGAIVGAIEKPGAGSASTGSREPVHAPEPLQEPVPALAEAAGEETASAPLAEADVAARAETVAAARAEPASPGAAGAREDQLSAEEVPPAEEGTRPRPRREAIEWPVADLAQRQSSRRPAVSGPAPAAAGRAVSSRGRGLPDQDAVAAREGEPGRAGSPMGRGGRPTAELIGFERVPALGSEPEQRFQAAEHAEATGARETAVWMYVQAADGFAARDGSQAALDACHRALAVSPGSADAHLALVRLYMSLGWRERAAEKLLLLDRLLELDRAPADRERVAAMTAEMFADDLRFPRTPPGA